MRTKHVKDLIDIYKYILKAEEEGNERTFNWLTRKLSFHLRNLSEEEKHMYVTWKHNLGI